MRTKPMTAVAAIAAARRYVEEFDGDFEVLVSVVHKGATQPVLVVPLTVAAGGVTESVLEKTTPVLQTITTPSGDRVVDVGHLYAEDVVEPIKPAAPDVPKHVKVPQLHHYRKWMTHAEAAMYIWQSPGTFYGWVVHHDDAAELRATRKKRRGMFLYSRDVLDAYRQKHNLEQNYYGEKVSKLNRARVRQKRPAKVLTGRDPCTAITIDGRACDNPRLRGYDVCDYHFRVGAALKGEQRKVGAVPNGTHKFDEVIATLSDGMITKDKMADPE